MRSVKAVITGRLRSGQTRLFAANSPHFGKAVRRGPETNIVQRFRFFTTTTLALRPAKQHNAHRRFRDECPRLRALWLFRQRHQRCEGLTELAELREPWLQNNKMKRLGGLEALTALRDLQLAGNPISDYRDLPRLARLPSLESVGFRDAHFGSCPIAERKGIGTRCWVLCDMSLPLDASEVTRQDRHRARDAHLENVLEFHEKVDALQREHRDDAAAIEARRRRSSAHARSLDGEMRLAFAELERLVDEGRQAVKQEHAKAPTR